MDYEKKYKEALEKAKEFYILCKKCGAKDTIDFLEDSFSELKKSEDDRIRKALIRFHKSSIDIDGIKGDDILAWLEKQGKETSEKEFTFKALPRLLEMIEVSVRAKAYTEKLAVALDNEGYHTDAKIVRESIKIMNGEEVPMAAMDEQKPINKVQPKFKVGEWITNGDYTWKIVEVKPLDYILQSQDGNIVDDTISHVDEQFHSFTIQDAKDGDVLYSPCLSLLWIFKSRDTVYCGCNLNYNDGAFCVEGYFEMPTDAIPATKEQHDTLMKAMTDAGWEFDFDKKELKKISQRMVSAEAKEAMYDKPTDEEMKELLRTEYEKGRADAIAEIQNPVRSEEDNKWIESLIQTFKDGYFEGFKQLKSYGIIDWLESLKDRCTWKPSDKQMKALHDMNLTGNISYAGQGQTLIELYNDLKKLKEE